MSHPERSEPDGLVEVLVGTDVFVDLRVQCALLDLVELLELIGDELCLLVELLARAPPLFRTVYHLQNEPPAHSPH